jgi:hypothetical protein
MPQPIWTKSAGDITIDDVVAFCESGIAENITLDYKRDFPSGDKLAKTVSAFANTFGGLIIIGVDEDDTSRPKAPFEGILFEPKLEERVWSILTDHVHPPVFPDVQVCPPENDRTFVVIRVLQSDTTPHAVRNNTLVYLRVGNITKGEDAERYATVPEADWLRNRRAKSEELKERLVGRAFERYARVSDLHGFAGDAPKATVWLGPKFPTGPVVTLSELDEFRGATKLHADRYSEIARVYEGMTHTYKGDHGVETFTETSVFGYTFHSAGIKALHLDNPTVLFISLITDAVADTVRFASRFLPAAGFWGEIELHVILQNIKGAKLRKFRDAYFFGPAPQIDNSFEVTRDLAGSIWRDERALQATITDIMTSIAWAFGGKLQPQDVLSYLEDSQEWKG